MQSNHKARLLIVDQDVNMGKFLSSYLTRRGFEVSNATTTDEALRMFRVFDPVLVLLDISAPGMSDLDTLEQLKRIKPDVSVVLMSAHHDPGTIFRASRLGAGQWFALARRRATRRCSMRPRAPGTGGLASFNRTPSKGS